MPLVFAGVCSHAPGITGRADQADPEVRDRFYAAFDRMRILVADQDVTNTVRHRTLPIDRHEVRTRPAATRPERVPLERLDVVDLRAEYPAGGGIRGATFSIARGEFVVVTGPVGGGKTTLLRAILGLAWQADLGGSVRWNRPDVSRALAEIEATPKQYGGSDTDDPILRAARGKKAAARRGSA